MLNILSLTDSNKKILLKHFSYLIDIGYLLSGKLINNTVEEFIFSNKSGDLVEISFDIRENYVNLFVLRNASKLISLDYELVYYSDMMADAKIMLALVKKKYAYFKSLKRYSLSYLFEEVVTIYAEFLKPYLL